MTIKFYGIPNCGTCKKAKKVLADHSVEFTEYNLKETTPTKEELKDIVKNSELPLKKFFNTSGNVYKESNMKDKLPTMTEDEQIELLSSEGMLMKRPLVTDGEKVTIGFKEEEFLKVWQSS